MIGCAPGCARWSTATTASALGTGRRAPCAGSAIASAEAAGPR